MSINRIDIETFPNFGETATRKGMEKRRQATGTMKCKNGYVVVLAPEEHHQQLHGRPDLAELFRILDLHATQNVESEGIGVATPGGS